MSNSLEFVFVKLSEAFVTAGQERPGIVLKRNDDGSADVLVFHHPSDRQSGTVESWSNVPADQLRPADGSEPPAESAPDAASGDSEPAAPVSGITGGSGKGRGAAGKLATMGGNYEE